MHEPVAFDTGNAEDPAAAQRDPSFVLRDATAHKARSSSSL
jgi:hypothetical protein